MKAVLAKEYAPVERLRLEKVAPPRPSAGEVVIAVNKFERKGVLRH